MTAQTARTQVSDSPCPGAEAGDSLPQAESGTKWMDRSWYLDEAGSGRWCECGFRRRRSVDLGRRSSDHGWTRLFPRSVSIGDSVNSHPAKMVGVQRLNGGLAGSALGQYGGFDAGGEARRRTG